MNPSEEIREPGRQYLENKLNPARWVFSHHKFDSALAIQWYSEAIAALKYDCSSLAHSFFRFVPILASSSILGGISTDRRYGTENFIGLSNPPQPKRIEEYIQLFCEFYVELYAHAGYKPAKIEISDRQTFPNGIRLNNSQSPLLTISSADVPWDEISQELSEYDRTHSLFLKSVGISRMDDVAPNAPGALYFLMREGLMDLAMVDADSLGQRIRQFLSENPELHKPDPLQLLDALATKLK